MYSAETLLDFAVKGLLTGLVYGLSALGLSVIFGVIRIVNFAHGEFMVAGMFLALLMAERLGVDPLIGIPIVSAILFAVGYGVQKTMVNRLLDRPEHMQFLLMAALALVIVHLCLMAFGPDARNVDLDYAYDSFELAGLILDKTRVYAAFAALLIAGALLAFFRYTRTGKAIRACADNRFGAQVVGLDVRHLYAITFGIGAACIGAAGCILLLLFDVHPYLATELTLLGFIIVIIGGLGSLAGALLGGVLIGVSEAMSGLFLQPSLKSVASFGLMILILALRPQGFLGKVAK